MDNDQNIDIDVAFSYIVRDFIDVVSWSFYGVINANLVAFWECVWILLSWAALVSLKKSPKQRMKIKIKIKVKIKIKIKLECELVIDGWVVLRILMDYLMPHALEIYFLLFVCWDN